VLPHCFIPTPHPQDPPSPQAIGRVTVVSLATAKVPVARALLATITVGSVQPEAPCRALAIRSIVFGNPPW
jgi:hypothetical protein